MTDHIAAHFGALRQEMCQIKRQLKLPTKLAAPIPKLVIPWTTALSECKALTAELKAEIFALKNHTLLPTTPNMITYDIERIVLRTVQSLIP